MKQATILGGALAVSLVATYVTWFDDGEDRAADTDVTVLSVQPGALERITFTSDEATITVEEVEDDLGAYLRITHVDRDEVVIEPEPIPDDVSDPDAPEAVEEDGDDGAEGPEGADGDEADAPAEPEPETEARIETTTVTFLGNEDAQGLWDAFQPLTALRQLSVGDDLSAFGLDDPASRIEVVAGGDTLTLQLGGEAYGTRDAYVGYDGGVYLVDDKTLRPLVLAKTRLVERRLHPLDQGDIASVEVRRAGDPPRTLVQRHADDDTKAFWALGEAPEVRSATATAWMGKLLRLRVRAWPDEGAEAPTLEPVFAYQVTGDDGAAWPVEILRDPEADKPTFYARSAWTRQRVELTYSLVDEAVADLDALFSASADDEPPPEEDEEATEEGTEAPEGEDVEGAMSPQLRQALEAARQAEAEAEGQGEAPEGD